MSRKGENIRKRKDGRWEARYIKSRTQSGKIIYGYIYGKSYREVKLKRQNLLPEIKNTATYREGKYTFSDLTDMFLKQEEYAVKYSTFVHYRNIIETHIRPYLADFELSKITSIDIEEFSRKMLVEGRLDGKGGLSEKTVNDMLSVIRLILKYGIDKKLLTYDILSFKAPKVKKKPIQTFNKEETEKIKRKAIESEEAYKFGVCLCLFTGLRIGEICALKWDDIDFENSFISVNKTMLRLQDTGASAKTRLVIDTPKTESSNRIIPIPNFIEEELKRRNKKAKGNNTYLLTGTTKYMEPRRYYEKYKRFLKECGIYEPHSFHCLRHTFATNCVEIGFDPKTLSEILGHSDVRITLDRYVHPSFERKRSCMALLN